MNDLTTAAQQALSTLEGWNNYGKWVWPESALEQAKRNTTESLAALRAALEQPETCTWYQDGDSDSDTYSTSCGHYFVITDGTPEDNKMRHCCYCGKKLVQELITEDDDE